MIRVVIPGEPVAQGRGRAVRFGDKVRVVDPKESRTWKATAQDHIRAGMAGRPPFSEPLAVTYRAIFACPASRHLRRGVRPRAWYVGRKDLDNLVKASFDAGLGVSWVDDRIIAVLRAVALVGAQGEAPRVEIHIEPLPPTPEGWP